MATETHIPLATKAVEGAAQCWACSATMSAEAHFCPVCGKVQPPVPLDYFKFFGLSRRLNLDVTALEKEFYRLSRKLHPDLYARATAPEQEWSLERSSQLNDAYRTLKDPIARTQYLLGLEGIRLEEQSKAATDAARSSGGEKKQVVPPELLEEVFELNVHLQELQTEGRDPEVVAQLEAAQRNFAQRLEEIAAQLQAAWQDYDAAADEPARRQAVAQMVEILNRRSYIRNLVRDVKEALRN